MNCKEVQELLPAYEGMVLTAPETAEVKNHLATCKSCQREFDLLSATWAMLEVLEPIQPSADFRARFWEKVRQEEEKKSWLPVPRLVPVLAGFLGVWVVGVGIGATLFVRSHAAAMRSQSMIEGRSWNEGMSLGQAYLRRTETL